MFRGGIGASEILLILGVVILMFGAKKLPDLARGSGRALRIFKSETKGLVDHDDDNRESSGDPKALHEDDSATARSATQAGPTSTQPESTSTSRPPEEPR